MIVLTGVPRAGKTTLGRKLASILHVPFYDLDELVLKRCASSYPRIDSLRTLVQLYGETALRTVEKEEIAFLQKCKEGVLALGGGTLLGDITLSEMFPKGLYLHLSLSFPEFLKRILVKQLPSTCAIKTSWHPALLEFYQARYDAAAASSHHTINVYTDVAYGVSSNGGTVLEKIIMHIPASMQKRE